MRRPPGASISRVSAAGAGTCDRTQLPIPSGVVAAIVPALPVLMHALDRGGLQTAIPNRAGTG